MDGTRRTTVRCASLCVVLPILPRVVATRTACNMRNRGSHDVMVWVYSTVSSYGASPKNDRIREMFTASHSML